MFNKHSKSISAASRPKYSVYRFTILTKEFTDLSNLKRHSFLPHMKVAELKHNVIHFIMSNNSLNILPIVSFCLLSFSLFYCMGKR